MNAREGRNNACPKHSTPWLVAYRHAHTFSIRIIFISFLSPFFLLTCKSFQIYRKFPRIVPTTFFPGAFEGKLLT